MVAAERRYWFLEVLGRGAFGSVYRVELQGRAGFRKPVAVKLLHPDRTSAPEIVRRLRDEARLMAHVSHPGIVQVDGLLTLRGQWAMVMEYVQGVSVRELVALGPVPILCAVQIVQLTAEALNAAHNATDGDTPLQLVHRDIKPSNIMLTRDGVVKLVDFGVALAAPEAREARSDELFFGAAEYMAPERWDFEDTPAADVYSLGAVLWELLTGELLGRTSTHIDRHCDLVEEALSRIEHLDNAELNELLRGMLEYHAQERPNARQVADACRKIAPTVPGPWLSEWAEREVPRARSRRAMDQDDPLIDVVLTEGEDPEVTAVLPSVPLGGAFSRVRTVTLLAVAALAALTWFAVDATEQLRQADERTSRVTKRSERAPPRPAPTPRDAAPAPAPSPDAQAPTPQAPTAHVSIAGDASELFLVGAAGRFPPGDLPAGSYSVQARFDGRGLVEAGTVQVDPGARITLTCDSGFALCKVQ
jgi:serine/threonine protein kinase